jgi:predicted N-acetyltransferase YhbS
MPAAYAIRAAVPADADGATAVAHAAKAQWGYPADWIEAWRSELTITAECLTRHRAWCAEAGEALIGVCSLEEGAEGWELGFLWVEPGRHGLGVGRALTTRALQAARELRAEWAVRVVSDPNAVGFYDRLGARRAGEVAAPMPGAPARMLPVLYWPGEGR